MYSNLVPRLPKHILWFFGKRMLWKFEFVENNGLRSWQIEFGYCFHHFGINFCFVIWNGWLTERGATYDDIIFVKIDIFRFGFPETSCIVTMQVNRFDYNGKISKEIFSKQKKKKKKKMIEFPNRVNMKLK